MGGRSVPDDPAFGLDAGLAGTFGNPLTHRDSVESTPGEFEMVALATTTVADGSGSNDELPDHTGNDR